MTDQSYINRDVTSDGIPIYGNYGGKGYCGKSFAAECDFSVIPVNPFDAAFLEHDRGYGVAEQLEQEDHNAAVQQRIYADLVLGKEIAILSKPSTSKGAGRQTSLQEARHGLAMKGK